MRKQSISLFLALSTLLVIPSVIAQDQNKEDILLIKTEHEEEESTIYSLDEKKFKTYPPYYDDGKDHFFLRNKEASFGRKILRGGGLTLGLQSATLGAAQLLPSDFTSWSYDFKTNFVNAFTMPPVIDEDPWYINYIGHPYQGAYYYNAYRSQGAKVWQSALMSVAHSAMWEYLIESNFERPSIQDLIVTPVLGSALGELTHYLTIQMSKNGFKWYEIVIVCIINPMWALNNGFKRFNNEYKNLLRYEFR